MLHSLSTSLVCSFEPNSGFGLNHFVFSPQGERRRSVSSSRAVCCIHTATSSFSNCHTGTPVGPTKVDRMVSPMPSPPEASMNPGRKSRHPSEHHPQNYPSCHCIKPMQGHHQGGSVCHDPGGEGYGLAPRGSLGHGWCSTCASLDDPRLAASRASLWSQKVVEDDLDARTNRPAARAPAPNRFGSLGHHDDHLIRRYLERSRKPKTFLQNHTDSDSEHGYQQQTLGHRHSLRFSLN